jgi:molecular chaperone GrpE
LSKKNEKTKSVDDEKNNDMEQSTINDEIVEDETKDQSNIEDENNSATISELEEKVLVLKDQLMRSLADGENLRKRTLKDIENSKKYSHISFVKDLVTSVDNFQRALKAVPEDKSSLPEPIKNLIVGLEIVEKEILVTLEKHNVKLIDPMGKKFDYNLHQAMFEVPTNEEEPGKVVEVSQKGYVLHDRLVRPAMVGISKKIDENPSDKNELKKKNKIIYFS